MKKLTLEEVLDGIVEPRRERSVLYPLYWVLDMAFREDESRARKDNSAENFNTVRQIALNILKAEKTMKDSLVNKQFACLLNDKYLDRTLAAWICS